MEQKKERAASALISDVDSYQQEKRPQDWQCPLCHVCASHCPRLCKKGVANWPEEKHMWIRTARCIDSVGASMCRAGSGSWEVKSSMLISYNKNVFGSLKFLKGMLEWNYWLMIGWFNYVPPKEAICVWKCLFFPLGMQPHFYFYGSENRLSSLIDPASLAPLLQSHCLPCDF